MRKRKYLLLPAQAVFMMALSALSSICPYLLYGILDSGVLMGLSRGMEWTIVPLGGALSAYFLTRRGINRYLSWILPPVCYSLLPWLLIGYPPAAGVMLVTAFVSIVGAAAGEVKNQMDTTDK